MTNDPGEGIARRDDVLELLFWIEGEGFSGTATLDAIARFLTHAPDLVRGTLDTSSSAVTPRTMPCPVSIGSATQVDVKRHGDSRRSSPRCSPKVAASAMIPRATAIPTLCRRGSVTPHAALTTDGNDSALHEIAAASNVGRLRQEAAIPIRAEVRGASNAALRRRS